MPNPECDLDHLGAEDPGEDSMRGDRRADDIGTEVCLCLPLPAHEQHGTFLIQVYVCEEFADPR